jgi:multiple sugar transport system permease protein/raffinose/stachyose/melibiose transport system permease protein
MLSLVLVGIIWQLIYARDEGLLNNVLGTAGQPNAVDWFGNPHVNLWAALVATAWRHAGYIMVLYLAGLKGVDPSLREAAAIDGATARQTFFRVVFPAMRPINIVIVVITLIEALRAFDIVYVINHGTNGLELLSVLVIQNLVGEGQVIGVGSALAVILLVVSLVPIVWYLIRTFRKAV